MNPRLSLANLLGRQGQGIQCAMEAGERFLQESSPNRLLECLGRDLPQLPSFETIDKSPLPKSYGGGGLGPTDDFLVGRGLFYLSEQRRLFLDCTSGHYQMLWGYQHPELCEAAAAAAHQGIVWDNHTNIPQAPLKALAHKLVEAGNAPGESDPLDKILLGVCTGSVACAAALKTQLRVFELQRGRDLVPVILVLDGSYHGTDMVAQTLRGMWPGLVQRCEVVVLAPNDRAQLESAFAAHSGRIAGFWAEPVLMNREAIAIEGEYLQLAREYCDQYGALMCIDEIQTGFWTPNLFAYRDLKLRPDLVVLGKGMTAGYHPLSGVLFKSRHDVLEQYDAISTNGSAAMPAFVSLCSIELIAQNAGRIRSVAAQIEKGFRQLAARFPDRLESAQGRGYLAGLKFRDVVDAKTFHRTLLARGLWTRVHAYHEGHRTVLTKLGLLADEPLVNAMLEKFEHALANP